MNQFTEVAGHWIRPSERSFIRRVDDWLNQVESQHLWHLTDFLTPREQILLTSRAKQRGCEVAFMGGYSGAERNRARVMPENWYPTFTDFEIVRLQVQATDSKCLLSHGSVLGAVLGLGIERRVLGDIAHSGQKTFFMVAAEISTFLLNHLHQVGRDGVQLTAVAEEVAMDVPRYEETVISVATLRADAVIAQTCHLSRSNAQTLISKGQVSLNFRELADPDESIATSDLLSVRGYGRIRVLEILGSTKRERQRLKVGILRSDKRQAGS